MVVFEPRALVLDITSVLILVEYEKLNQEFAVLQAIGLDGHGLFVDNTNQAPFIFHGNGKKTDIRAEDKLGMELVDGRSLCRLGLEIGYGLDIKT